MERKDRRRDVRKQAGSSKMEKKKRKKAGSRRVQLKNCENKTLL